jgi:hypothetical protein
MMVEWAQLAPAIGGGVLGLVLWLSAHRIHANRLRDRERAKAEREGHISS